MSAFKPQTGVALAVAPLLLALLPQVAIGSSAPTAEPGPTSAILIVFFAYFYTSIIFNPVDLAENLKKQGGFIPGVKPGAATADYIDDVLSRITLPGAMFLTVVAMLPIIISNVLNMPFGFGGTALLIVVGVALDTVQQVQQHLLLRHYDGFMKEGRVKFRGRQRYM